MAKHPEADLESGKYVAHRPGSSERRVIFGLALALLVSAAVFPFVSVPGGKAMSPDAGSASASTGSLRTAVPNSLYPYPEQRVGFVAFASGINVGALHAGFVKLEDRGPTALEKSFGLGSCTVILEDTQRWELPDPATYWARIDQLVRDNLGHLWFIGNEPDNPCRFGTFSGEYAQRYHTLYHFIKDRDATAQVGIGGVVRPSEIRMEWLERVLDAYKANYGEPMPVDVWNIHNLLLSECPGECGCPEGNTCGDLCCSGGYVPREFWCRKGLYISQEQQDRLDLFEQYIWDFRHWMETREEARDKPLIVTEMGVFAGVQFDNFPHERINQFMAAAFDFMMNTVDPEVGYAPDGNRLVQRWTWYSLQDANFNGFLFDPQGNMTDFGLNFANYTARFLPESPIGIFFQRGWTGYAEDCDTTLRPAEPGPGGYNLWISADQRQKAMLQFDLSVLPANVQVVSAELRLVSSQKTDIGDMTVNCYGIRRPWNVHDATWLNATQATAWEVPGCGGAGDRDLAPVSSVLVTTEDTAYSLDVTSLAQVWVANPSANHGVLLEGEAAGTGYWTFVSSDQPERPPYGLHRLRPKLELVVQLPEPTTTGTETATPLATATPTRTPSPTITSPIPLHSLHLPVIVRGM